MSDCERTSRGPFPRSTSDHHYYIGELERAASEFCPVCQVLWNAVSDRTPTDTNELPKDYTFPASPVKKPISRYRITYLSDSRTAKILSFVVNHGLE